MDKVFSVDDFSGQFWSPPPTPPPPAHPPFLASIPAQVDPKMNRSASEWAFQRFLQEHEVTISLSDTNSPSKSVDENGLVIKDHQHRNDPQGYHHDNGQGLNRNNGAAPQHLNNQSRLAPETTTAPFHTGSSNPTDPAKLQAYLKSRLNLACAAALTRAPYVVGQSPSGTAESTSQGSTNSHALTQPSGKGSKEKDVGGPLGIPSLPAVPKKHAAQIKAATSGSSRDLSDDDEAEGENELNENMDPDDAKRARRMLSNRESARRSRRRKQEHASELESQVSELKIENSSLLNRYSDISQKYNEAAVDNRVLKADVETLRAKVKMAEETVKRVTGMNTLLQTISIPDFSGSRPDSVDHAALPPYDNPKQHFFEPPAPARHY